MRFTNLYVSHDVIVNLIAATTTHKGLRVHAEMDDAKYEKGIKMTDTKLVDIGIARDDYRSE
jgi:hypothetical protein